MHDAGRNCSLHVPPPPKVPQDTSYDSTHDCTINTVLGSLYHYLSVNIIIILDIQVFYLGILRTLYVSVYHKLTLSKSEINPSICDQVEKLIVDTDDSVSTSTHTPSPPSSDRTTPSAPIFTPTTPVLGPAARDKHVLL